jgi:hypothetical protein
LKGLGIFGSKNGEIFFTDVVDLTR